MHNGYISLNHRDYERCEHYLISVQIQKQRAITISGVRERKA